MAGHPDEVVQDVQDVEDAPSRLVAEAKLRHENAQSDWATPQERKQAAVEQAHALSTRPDGSYAQLHETEEPTLAVADEAAVKELKKDQEQARERLRGSEPVNTEAGAKREEDAAKQRDADREATARQAQAEQKSAEPPKQAARK